MFPQDSTCIGLCDMQYCKRIGRRRNMSNTKVSPTQNIDSELHQQAAEERPSKVTLAAIESAENDLDLHGPFSSIEELMNDLNL